MRRLLAPLLLVGLWLVAWSVGWPGPRAVPSPTELARTALEELPSRALWRDVAATVARVGAGLAVALLLGGSLGLALGISTRRWRAAEPTVDFLRSVPPILTFPLFLLALGYGEPARIAAVIFGTTGIVLLHVASGLARAPAARADVVRVAGLRGWPAFVHLHLWEALPSLLVGTRVARAAGLVIAVVSEMIVGADHGLGGRAVQALLAYRADRLWLVILVAGAIGQALSRLVVMLERRLVDW